MSYISNIGIRPGSWQDAFGRLRVSEPTNLFNAQLQYDLNPYIWDTILAGAGSVTHQANRSSAALSNGDTASGSRAVFTSRQYIRYQPGKSQQFFVTFVGNAAQTNVIKRIGLFDDENGIFVQQSGTGALSFTIRSYVTGAAVENTVAQASWNVDTLDGNGPSGVTIDFTKAQIFVADIEWLGVGSVRVGFVVDGEVIVAHQFNHANSLDSVYMSTANLPVRYEIINDGIAGAVAELEAICSSVNSEGGFAEDRAILQAVATPVALSCGTAGAVVLAIRPKLTFGGLTNRATIAIDGAEAVGSGDGRWELYYTNDWTAGAWNSVDANGVAEFSINATIGSGSRFAAALLSGTNQNRVVVGRDIRNRFPATLGANGTAQWGFALVGYSVTGSITVRGALGWLEFR